MEKDRNTAPRSRRGATGQSMIEYSLIAALVILALIAALIATGSAIGNVFSEAVFAAIGAEGNSQAIADGPTAFWETVEWIQDQPVVNVAQGTNIPDIPTLTPEGYVAPTQPPPLPTDTVQPSPTFTPSHTPTDASFNLTFLDEGGNDETSDWYRLSANTFVGLHAWTARFYQDTSSGEPLDPGKLKFSTSYWENPGTEIFIGAGTDIPRITEQWFSAQLRREIYITEDQRLSFRINNPGGGVRLYYQDEGTCANFKPPSSNRGVTTTSPCMIIDEWNDVPPSEIVAFKDFPKLGGQEFYGYVLYLEYYQKTGSPGLNLTIDSPQVNEDDAGLNGAPVSCNWGPFEGERSNTRPYAWNSAVGLDGNNIPDNTRCHFELRGVIERDPESALGGTAQTLTFWHIWDLNNNTNIKLEIAEYEVDGDGNPVGRVGAWQPVWPPAALNGTRNYEWVQEEVVLDTATYPWIDDANRGLTYRFVIENDGGGGGRKRWYIDDIRVGSRNLPDLTDTNPVAANTFSICDDTTTCASFWNMEDPAQVQRDFRYTGRWGFTSNGAHVGTGIGDDVRDGANNRYSLEQGADLNSVPTDRRIYWVEFDKRVDVRGTTPTTDAAGRGFAFISDADPNTTIAPADEDGDDGAPMISFWHSYNLRDNVKLQVQYYDDDDGSWQLLREVAGTGPSGEASASSTFVQVPLNEREIPDANGYGTGVFESYVDATTGWTDWVDRPLRIRFAMIVDENAISSATNGWTIDDIEIERLGNFTYTRYPFGDSAGDAIIVRNEAAVEDQRDVTYEGFEDSLDRWLRTGTWAIAEERAYTGQYVFSDSPNANYVPNTDSTLELRAAVDLNSDTPENPLGLGCNAALPSVPSCDPLPHPAANNPVLSFWWNRDLASGSRFTVEIRKNGGVDAPITVWEYNYNSSNGTQPSWERAEIALDPFVFEDADPAIVTDDDIVIVFRLDTTGNTTSRANGVFVDDIRLNDAPQIAPFKLWTGESDDDIEGDGNRYIDTVDDRTILDGDSDLPNDSANDTRGRWWNRWHLGGDWYSDYFEYNYLAEGGSLETGFMARSGTQLFHESPPTSSDPFDDENSFRYLQRSFNVLEMIRTIDMTGLETPRSQGDPEGIATGGDNGSPILYWWQRLDRGDESRLLVQVATRLDNPSANRVGNPLTYGTDELYGWSEWQTVFMTNDNDDAHYAWVRRGVNLANAPIYNSNGSRVDTENFVGEEIRVRFVLDATDVQNNSDRRDGWFIDDIEFTTIVPRIHPVPFVDFAESMSNWVADGTWGLDVDVFRGGTSIPDILGTNWTARYLNCDNRPNNVDTTPTERTNNGAGGCSGAGISEEMLINQNYRDTYGNFNSAGQWYIEDTITTLSFDYDYNDLPNDGPPGSNPNQDWGNDFAAEFQRTLVIDTPYRYQFYVRGDDGVRVGITPFPTTAEVQRFAATQNDVNIITADLKYNDPNVNGGADTFVNNVINGWRDQGPTVYRGAVTLVPNPDNSPRTYTLTVHYYENGGGAEVAFGMSGAAASFSDSPLLIPQEVADEVDVDGNPIIYNADANRVPANYLSNTSLTLDGLLDLRTTTKPILRYYTLYDMNNISARSYLEVTEDGGFTWTQDNLRGTVDAPGISINANSPTNWNGRDTDWQERTNALDDYAGKMIGLRFRIDVDGNLNQVQNEASDTDSNQADGVYITDILVYDLEPNTPAPRIIINPPLSVFVSTGESQQISVVAGGQAPLRYEWFLGEPPVGDPGVPGTTPAGNVAVGTNSATYSPPDDLDPGIYTYWVRVSNTVSDNDNSIPAIASIPTDYRVSECVPINLGDCDIYRINVNGGDVASRDGTSPNWFGDNDTATAFRPTGNYWNGSDGNISIANVSSNEFITAAQSGPAPEIVYERFRATTGSMAWNFPVEAGEYTIRFYMADPWGSTNQGNMTVTVNGAIADYKTGGVTQPLSNINFSDITGNANQQAAIIELSAVTVTPTQGALNIQVTKSGEEIFVSGIEVFPVTSLDPVIVEEPLSGTVPVGATKTINVSATGANLTFQWYRGSSGDESNPINTGDTFSGSTFSIADNTSGLSGTSILTITNFSGTQNFWAKVTGGPNANQSVNSATARLNSCVYDPSTAQNGECGYWYINIGGDNNITASDGTVWFSEGNGEPWDGSGVRRQSDNLNGFTYSGNVLESHVPRTVFQDYADDNFMSYSLDVSYPGANSGGNGFYDITLYLADRNNDASRRDMNITIEGVLVVSNYHPINDSSCGGSNRFCSITFEGIEVTDGFIDIEVSRASNRNYRVNAIEIRPQ